MYKIHSLGLTDEQTLTFLNNNGYTNIKWDVAQKCYFADLPQAGTFWE